MARSRRGAKPQKNAAAAAKKSGDDEQDPSSTSSEEEKPTDEDEEDTSSSADDSSDEEEQDDEENAEGDGTDGDEENDEEEKARRLPAAQRAIDNAVTAERARITGILALRNRASMDALMGFINDPKATPESAAHSLMTGKVKGARNSTLANLANDEAKLQQNGGLSGDGEPTTHQTEAQRILATVQQFNPRAVARKPRD